MNDYDAIVVGAGLGGLSAAASLAKSGKTVLLLEKHNVPGGYASSFMRGRFEFDASLHALSGVGAGDIKGPLWMLLDEYGITDKVNFIPIPELYRCVLPELDVTVPVGRENFEQTLCDRFPAEAQGIKRFSAAIFDFAGEAIGAGLLDKGVEGMDLSKLPTMKAYLGKSMAEVSASMIEDEKARAVLGQLCHYLGQPPSKTDFLPYAMAAMSYLSFGPVHIKGTSQALSQAFVDVIEEHGGQVRLNNGASRILVSDERVVGVVDEAGHEIASEYVICNANPLHVCRKLISPEQIPDWYLDRLAAWSPGLSTANVFLGLDRPMAEFGLRNHETFVGLDYDLDRQYQLAAGSLEADLPGASVAAYNAAEPDFSPPGTSAVVITTGAYAGPWLELGPDEYQRAKDNMIRKSLDLAEIVAPGLRNHIEVLEASTPLTNIRYSGNPGGSFTGFAESRMPGSLPPLPNRGPLPGLYFAGAWARIGGGYMPCMFSGRLASLEAMEDMDRGGCDPKVIVDLGARMTAQVKGLEPVTDIEAILDQKPVFARHPGLIELRVEKIIEETPSTKTFRLLPAKGGLPGFRAGQYVNLFVTIDGHSTSRPFSLSSPPGAPYWEITVRRKEKGYVSHYLLDRVRPGDVLESSGPSGDFFIDPVMDTGELVFLAGGSGITPFASMIREAVGQKSTRTIHLLYGCRSPEDVVFGNELTLLAQEIPNFKFDLIISDPVEGWTGRRGLLDAETIFSVLEAVLGKTFFICGPAPMQDLCGRALESLGVPGRQVKKEACGPPDDVSRDPDWPGIPLEAEFTVVEELSGLTFSAKAGEPLMNSLERAGLVVPAVCRSGECAACRTRLISGKVFAPAAVQHRWVDEKAGFIHPCMTYPLDDLRLRL